MTNQPNEEREWWRLYLCNIDHISNTKAVYENSIEELLEEQERRTKSELSDAEKVVMLLAKIGDMNNDDHRSMATVALKNLDQQRHADYIASLLSKIQHLEEELEDAQAAYGRANARAMGLV